MNTPVKTEQLLTFLWLQTHLYHVIHVFHATAVILHGVVGNVHPWFRHMFGLL